jgi:hypothetical protein
MGLDKFKTFDPKLVDKVGKDQIGKAVWCKLNEAEKMTKAFRVITDRERNAAAIKTSNFDTLLVVFSKLIGGVAVQEEIIKGQNRLALRSISSQKDIAEQLYTVYQKTKLLAHNQEPTEAEIKSFQEEFSVSYKALEEAAFVKLPNPEAVDSLAAPMEELFQYDSLAATLKWNDERKAVVEKMMSLIRRQIAVVAEHETVSQGKMWKLTKPSIPVVSSWNNLSPLDWINLLGSFNSLSCDKQLNTAFSHERVVIDLLKHKATAWTDKRKGSYANFICFCGKPLTESYRYESCDIQYIEKGSNTCRLCHHSVDMIKISEGVCCRHRYQVQPNFETTGECKYCHAPLHKNYCGYFDRGPPYKGCSKMSCSIQHNYSYLKTTNVSCIICGTQNFTFEDTYIGFCCNNEVRYFPAWLDTITLTKKRSHNGDIAPTNSKNYHLKIPDTISDPKHFGYLIWKFSTFLESKNINLIPDDSNHAHERFAWQRR